MGPAYFMLRWANLFQLNLYGDDQRNTGGNYSTKFLCLLIFSYRKTFSISRTFVDIKIVGHSDVVEASPAGATPTTSSFST